MKKILCFGIFFICLGLLFSASNAFAVSTSFSYAYIDLDSLEFSFIVDGGNKMDIVDAISPSGGESGSEAEAWDNDGDEKGSVWEDDWVDTNMLAEVNNALGYGWTGAEAPPEVLEIDIDNAIGELVWAHANGINTEEAHSWARAECYQEFMANQSGTLTISVDYFLNQDLDTDYLNDYAYGFSYAELGLVYFDGSVDSIDNAELEEEVWDENTLSQISNGILTASLWFEQGDEGVLWGFVENKADVYSEYSEPIPEPATLALLGSLATGLFSVASLKKKF